MLNLKIKFTESDGRITVRGIPFAKTEQDLHNYAEQQLEYGFYESYELIPA